MSSDPRTVARNRLAYSVNMWRDYESEQGAAVETFPGFRRLLGFTNEAIVGLWGFKTALNEDCIIVHAGEALYNIQLTEYDEIQRKYNRIESPEKIKISDVTLSDSDVGFVSNNNLFIISNKRYYKVSNGENGIEVEVISVEGDARGRIYVPTTYYNGKPYEQRNALGSAVIQIETGGGIEDSERADMRNVPLYDKLLYPYTLMPPSPVVD